MTRFGTPTRGTCPLCGAAPAEPVRASTKERLLDLFQQLHDFYEATITDLETERDLLRAGLIHPNGE